MTSSVVVSHAPIVVPSEGRGQPLEVRVSAPAEGDALPVIIFSHGNGLSLHAYGPLANHWAAHGFAVVQPTHLDSRTLGLADDDPRRPDFWRYREHDLLAVLDGLGALEETIPAIAGRLDHSRVAVAGHSWGALCASTLLGAVHPDPEAGTPVERQDARVKAGVLLGVAGTGGDNLTTAAAAKFPFMHPDYSGMTTPALIVAGDRARSPLTHRGPDWWREAYDMSPSPKALLTLFGGEHSLGGIPNYEAKETTDERPQRVAAIQRTSTAYLRSIFYPEDSSWREVVAQLALEAKPEGAIQMK